MNKIGSNDKRIYFCGFSHRIAVLSVRQKDGRNRSPQLYPCCIYFIL
jgi:hypothetical protein